MRTALAIACTVCTASAGCGGDDESTVPASRYAERGDELCRQLVVDVGEVRTQERLREIQEAESPEPQRMRRAADVLSEQQVVVTAFRRRFEALGTPSEHRDDAEQLLEKTRAAEAELERAIEALREGDGQEAGDALRRYAGLSQQTATIARDSELDFAICGAGA